VEGVVYAEMVTSGDGSNIDGWEAAVKGTP
jgi:hypothetical protein